MSRQVQRKSRKREGSKGSNESTGKRKGVMDGRKEVKGHLSPRHFEPSHDRGGCEACQEFSHSPEVSSVLSQLRVQPNAVSYLKKKYSIDPEMFEVKMTTSKSQNSNSFLHKLDSATAKYRQKVLNTGIKIREDKEELFKKFENAVVKRPSPKERDLDLKNVLLHHEYKEPHMQQLIAAKMGVQLPSIKSAKEKISDMDIHKKNLQKILGLRKDKAKRRSRHNLITKAKTELSQEEQENLAKQLEEQKAKEREEKHKVFQEKLRQRSEERKKMIEQANAQYKSIKAKSPLYLKYEEKGQKLREEEEMKYKKVSKNVKTPVAPVKQLKREFRSMNKIKSELQEKLKQKRLEESRNANQTKFDPKRFQTDISMKTRERDQKLALLRQVKTEDLKRKISKRQSYADKVQKLAKIHINEEKRKEINSFIEQQNKPAKEKVPKIKRKKGGYYSIKFKKPKEKSLLNANSLTEDKFYSELSTTKIDRSELQERPDPNKSAQPISIQRNNDNTMNLNLTGEKLNKRKILPAYNRTYGAISNERGSKLRASTPDYNFKVSQYKSKLWDTQNSESGEKINSLTAEKYLKKSMELKNRARAKEIHFGQRSQSLFSKDAQEMSDMLIDSILYKVNVLQNV